MKQSVLIEAGQIHPTAVSHHKTQSHLRSEGGAMEAGSGPRTNAPEALHFSFNVLQKCAVSHVDGEVLWDYTQKWYTARQFKGHNTEAKSSQDV